MIGKANKKTELPHRSNSDPKKKSRKGFIRVFCNDFSAAEEVCE
jgi:hypothetical protein